MEIPNIAVVGAGALGARHLQALALLEKSSNIIVIDPSEISLKNAQDLFYQVKNASKHRIEFITDFNNLPKTFDVVIVATSSNVRRQVIEQMVAKTNINAFILEKVLFQELEDYDIILNLFTEHNINAWVNCPRRIHDFYKELKIKLQKASSMEVCITGSAWGLGCNSIHFLDLISFLAGHGNMKVDLTGLNEQYIQSKRQGFLEITGTITGSMGKCRSYSMTSYLNGDCPTTIQITSDIIKCVINETKKKALIADPSNNWEWTEVSFEVPYQSQLTNLVVQDILTTGNCQLTNYDTSIYLHKKLQKPLIDYFLSLGVEGQKCPIT